MRARGLLAAARGLPADRHRAEHAEVGPLFGLKPPALVAASAPQAFYDGHCPLWGIGIPTVNPGVPRTTAA